MGVEGEVEEEPVGGSVPHDITVEGNAVAVVVRETNNFYRWIELPPKLVRITYYFNDAGKVEGTLVDSAEDPPDRFEEAKAWLGEHHPAELRR